MSNILRIVLFLKISLVHCLLFPLHFKSEVLESDGGDPGTPLFLTPYVESGNITEGRRLAAVPFTEEMGIPSYSGFFTVNKTFNSNQFFWYFPPSSSANSKNAPVVVWLQGGPGVSSLFGLFTINGPLKVENDTFQHRKYNWAENHHVIYIDNPVGSGFSFTDNDEGYSANQTRVGEELYSTVVQFLQLFPELQRNKFYVTGESYAGKFVPALAYTIHKKNPTAKIKVNLKGLAIGNGFCDPEHQMGYSKFLYQIGLIDWNQEASLKIRENNIIEQIKRKEYQRAQEEWDNLLSNVTKMIGPISHYNYLSMSNGLDMDYARVLLQSSVRKQIHVGDLFYSKMSMKVYHYLKADMMQSIAAWLTELLDYYDVLMYSGHLDIIVAYPLSANFLRNLNFSAAEEYEVAARQIWKEDVTHLIGYYKKAGRLTEVMVKNAGHMVPTDQPGWSLILITRFTNGIFPN